MGALLAAASAFVGTHFALSHPLRAAAVARLGERGFMLLYSLVAAATLGWLVAAFRAVPPQPLAWVPTDAIWAVASAAMLAAAILFAGSLRGNPALPGAGGAAAPSARGVFAVTRHPMMWSFAVWAVVHVAVWPSAANAVLAGAILVLALGGAAGQDAKKAGDPHWRDWRRRTSYWPFARQIAGRARWRAAWPGTGVAAAGAALWLLATWAHLPLAGIAAGAWRWLG